jgi:deferrochelatase/peroxidase EfeB
MALVDYSDVQGLVRYGYGRMTEACFLLLRIDDPIAARSWLKTAPVTTAVERKPPPEKALQVAFTCDGLQALQIPPEIIQQFSPEFMSGMAGEESRSRRLGDVGANAPSRWQWGSAEKLPHVLVLLYAEPGKLEAWKQTVQGDSWDHAFSVLDCLEAERSSDTEPFGFKDGISQPTIDWDGERKPDKSERLEYSNLVTLGEFLLGYPNEYGKYSTRPLVNRGDDRTAELLPAEEDPDKRDLGRNGCYLVFRQLAQDVSGFWKFLDEQAKGNPDQRAKLAEAMVGRKMNGEALVPLSDRQIEGLDPDAKDNMRLNQFTYESDSDGARCPLGAHIRRANPRNGDLPYGTSGLLSRLIRTLGFGRKGIRDDMVSSTRFHRMLRRGRAYGATPLQERDFQSGQADNRDRGLYFICLNANIGRQFEFVQNAWIMGSKFDGLSEESDPLLGNRLPFPGCPETSTFSIPQPDGVRRRITGLPQFVTVRGGAYFFLPSIRALWYMATIGD